MVALGFIPFIHSHSVSPPYSSALSYEFLLVTSSIASPTPLHLFLLLLCVAGPRIIVLYLVMLPRSQIASFINAFTTAHFFPIPSPLYLCIY